MNYIELAFKLNEEDLKYFSKRYNRAGMQTQFLFNLCDGSKEKLELLVDSIKSKNIFSCPDSKDDVREILTFDYVRNSEYSIDKEVLISIHQFYLLGGKLKIGQPLYNSEGLVTSYVKNYKFKREFFQKDSEPIDIVLDYVKVNGKIKL